MGKDIKIISEQAYYIKGGRGDLHIIASSMEEAIALYKNVYSEEVREVITSCKVYRASTKTVTINV